MSDVFRCDVCGSYQSARTSMGWKGVVHVDRVEVISMDNARVIEHVCPVCWQKFLTSVGIDR